MLPARFCERGSYNEIHGSAAICAREVMLFHDRPGFISAVSASLPTMKSAFRDSAEKNLIRRNEARPTIWRDGEGTRPVTIFNSLEQQLSIEKDKATCKVASVSTSWNWSPLSVLHFIVEPPMERCGIYYSAILVSGRAALSF